LKFLDTHIYIYIYIYSEIITDQENGLRKRGKRLRKNIALKMRNIALKFD